MSKKLVSDKGVAEFAVGQARSLRDNPSLPDELRELPLDILANIIAFTADRVINDNVFRLYIAEKKIK